MADLCVIQNTEDLRLFRWIFKEHKAQSMFFSYSPFLTRTHALSLLRMPRDGHCPWRIFLSSGEILDVKTFKTSTYVELQDQ